MKITHSSITCKPTAPAVHRFFALAGIGIMGWMASDQGLTLNPGPGQPSGPQGARKGNTVVGPLGSGLRDWHGSHSPLGGHLDGVELCVYRSTGARGDERSDHAGWRPGNLSIPSRKAELSF